jgi:hypothetical protein
MSRSLVMPTYWPMRVRPYIDKTLRPVAVAHETLIEQQERPAGLADHWLKEAGIVQTQAASQDDELNILEAVPEAGGD